MLRISFERSKFNLCLRCYFEFPKPSSLKFENLWLIFSSELWKVRNLFYVTPQSFVYEAWVNKMQGLYYHQYICSMAQMIILYPTLRGTWKTMNIHLYIMRRNVIEKIKTKRKTENILWIFIRILLGVQKEKSSVPFVFYDFNTRDG